MTTIAYLSSLLIFFAIALQTTFISSAHISDQAVNNQTDANPSDNLQPENTTVVLVPAPNFLVANLSFYAIASQSAIARLPSIFSPIFSIGI